ncbi:MAG: hypothetical protein AB7I37_17650 [Pirellulales bacterium]
MSHEDFPRFMVVAGTKAVTIKSPVDGEDGLVACWTEAAAEMVAQKTPGAVVVRATPEVFVAAIREAHKMGIPWLYFGKELGNGVDFTKVRVSMALGLYAKDGQHRHGGK